MALLDIRQIKPSLLSIVLIFFKNVRMAVQVYLAGADQGANHAALPCSYALALLS